VIDLPAEIADAAAGLTREIITQGCGDYGWINLDLGDGTFATVIVAFDKSSFRLHDLMQLAMVGDGDDIP
jgi:hypothetical protein